MSMTKEGTLGFWTREIIAGSLGGASGILVGHPLDLLKVTQQNSQASTSAFSILQTVWRTNPLSVYRGLVPPLLNGIVYQSIMFPGYQFSLRLIQKPDDRPETLLESTVAGVLAGLMTTLGTSPLEIAKIKLQLDPKAQAGSPGATTKQLIKLFKKRQLYKGWTALAWRDGPGTGVYMASYHYLKATGKQYISAGEFVEFLSGGLAGVICWLSILPFDTVKTRLQLDAGTSQPAYNYKGLFDGMAKMARTEGVSTLFSGWRPLCIRAFPANAITFVVYEWVIKNL